MKCRIIKAGLECSDNPYADCTFYYAGVIIRTYKPKIIFKGYKKDRDILIELVYDKSKTDCLEKASTYFKEHQLGDIMKDIINNVKSEYGISDKDIEIANKINKINADWSQLIGKEFEIK